jgi:hypothetical protein
LAAPGIHQAPMPRITRPGPGRRGSRRSPQADAHPHADEDPESDALRGRPERGEGIVACDEPALGLPDNLEARILRLGEAHAICGSGEHLEVQRRGPSSGSSSRAWSRAACSAARARISLAPTRVGPARRAPSRPDLGTERVHVRELCECHGSSTRTTG